jgi:hypothetical protein
MFEVKSMDVNFSLLKLKLDTVYRDLPMEEAQKRFADATATVPAELAVPVATREIAKPKKARKVVKALVPKSG